MNLTAEEHFVAHQLLTKIYPNNWGLAHAAHMMTVGNETTVRNNNKRYGWIIKNLKNKPLSDSHKLNISKSWENRIVSEETKKRMTNTKTGKKRKPFSESHKKNMSFARRNISDETRMKMSFAKKGKTPWNKGKKIESN